MKIRAKEQSHRGACINKGHNDRPKGVCLGSLKGAEHCHREPADGRNHDKHDGPLYPFDFSISGKNQIGKRTGEQENAQRNQKGYRKNKIKQNAGHSAARLLIVCSQIKPLTMPSGRPTLASSCTIAINCKIWSIAPNSAFDRFLAYTGIKKN